MSTIKRRTRAPAAHGITAAAVTAYRAADRAALHAELRLQPWAVSPLDAVGVCPWPPTAAGAAAWPQSVALREALEVAL